MPLLLHIALFFLLATGSGWAESLEIGRWRVAIWPEYDDPGALVVYDGRFVDPTAFPAKTRFILPKGVVISDACSLSPGGQHFCQLYKIHDKGTYDEVELWLPYPNFYVSLHLPPPDLNQEQRQLDFLLQTNHKVERLEVDIQEPLRSREFAITPPGGERSQRKEFQHHLYVLENLAKGEQHGFGIRYLKADARPSVDIKFTRMTGEKVFGSPYDAQKRVSIYLYGLFGSGLVILLGLIGFWIKKKKRSTPLIILFCLLTLPVQAESVLTINEVARDLACPCTCPLILEDCNMSCGLDWKEEIGKMIADGKTKPEIMAYFHEKYGEDAMLTPIQRLEGKLYQYTRGFGPLEWGLLWAGIGFWLLLLFGGIFIGIKKFRSRS